MHDCGPDPPDSPQEHTGRDDIEAFHRAVTALFHGHLIAAYPFDYASASALRRNSDTGPVALGMFEADRARQMHYRIHITVHCPDQPDVAAREIAACTVLGTPPAVELLAQIALELSTLSNSAPEHTPRKGTPG